MGFSSGAVSSSMRIRGKGFMICSAHIVTLKRTKIWCRIFRYFSTAGKCAGSRS